MLLKGRRDSRVSGKARQGFSQLGRQAKHAEYALGAVGHSSPVLAGGGGPVRLRLRLNCEWDDGLNEMHRRG